MSAVRGASDVAIIRDGARRRVHRMHVEPRLAFRRPAGFPRCGGYVRVFNERGSLELRARVTDRARPRVVVALSVWWKKLARDGKNADELTNSDALTDLGRAPISYDCLVEVAPL